MPEQDGLLYFIVESYYNKMMPMSCTENLVPHATIHVYRNAELEHVESYYDQFHRPIMFYNYGAATFTIDILFDWNSSPI